MAAAVLAALGTTSAAASEPVSFTRDIRPLLSDACFHCHGPDPAHRRGKLRLDTREGLFGKNEDGLAIVTPGDPERSELVARVAAVDPDDRMPPADHPRALAKEQIALVQRWVKEGATWRGHWAFERPAPWVAGSIDAFVRVRLDKEGLPPSPPADRTALIRRVTLDLTGLPPTPAQVKAFVSDTRRDAFQRVVDRLLASPSYGERMALPWLEAARYADTSGYQADWERTMWPWRDWVIEAFNRNQPFDAFTVEQIAGDLLPRPTAAQLIATGFNRNHRINDEAGVIPEEFLAEYVIDRVETTTAAWLGLTAGCARCHDHKYDPLTQKEFYGLFGLFNNVPELGKDGRNGSAKPFLRVPTPGQERSLTRLLARVEQQRRLLARHDATAPTRLARWEAGRPDAAATMERALTRSRVDALSPERHDPFTMALSVRMKRPARTRLVERTDPGNNSRGFRLETDDEGRLEFQLVHNVENDRLTVVTSEPLATGGLHHVAATYDGSSTAAGVRVFVDGSRVSTEIRQDTLTSSISTKAAQKIGDVANLRLYTRQLATLEIADLAGHPSLAALLKKRLRERTPAETTALRAFFLEQLDRPRRLLSERLARAREDHATADSRVVKTMIMQELPRPRPTHVMLRGQYDQKGPEVAPGVPGWLPPLPPGAPANRLSFARWLVSPENPLTARVVVNRFWQMYFGVGLVKTAEDFGAQGELPSHPELLDWLAAEFVRLRWDVKAMQRLIVTSATYQQASALTPALLERDPENRLLARGPRLRLPGQTLRDQALAAAGLLVTKRGGPSVKPYQPAGLWEELSFNRKDIPTDFYSQDHGASLYRRSLYTFWKRSVNPPMMQLFDSPTREVCSLRPRATNTPLQALALLNETGMVEAARALAQRMLLEGGERQDDRLRHGFRLVLARDPSERELSVLRRGLRDHLARFDADPAEAAQVLTVGESPPPRRLPPVTLAAYTAVANVLFNLDEAITRP